MMRFEVRTEDKDIIKIDMDKAFIDLDSEDIIHHCLEGHRGVGKSKEHNERFIKAT
jgi:hypothetical protein